MMHQGLLEEAREVYSHRDSNALQTVGYKELFKYLDGDCSLEFAVSEIKKNTRRFAKRQLTWLNSNANIHWVDYNIDGNEVLRWIETELKKVGHVQ